MYDDSECDEAVESRDGFLKLSLTSRDTCRLILGGQQDDDLTLSIMHLRSGRYKKNDNTYPLCVVEVTQPDGTLKPEWWEFNSQTDLCKQVMTKNRITKSFILEGVEPE